MTVRMNLRTDVRRAVVELRELRDDVQNKATYRALNRALDKAATETGREIRKVYNVKARAVRAALKKRRANRKSLFARLLVEGVRLGLIEFDARWSRRQAGATVRVKVGGSRKTVRGSFIAASTSNNARGGGSMGMRQVYRRVGKGRYPIETLKSLSVPQAFANAAVIAALEQVALETFTKTYVQQVRFLNGGGGR